MCATNSYSHNEPLGRALCLRTRLRYGTHNTYALEMNSQHATDATGSECSAQCPVLWWWCPASGTGPEPEPESGAHTALEFGPPRCQFRSPSGEASVAMAEKLPKRLPTKLVEHPHEQLELLKRRETVLNHGGGPGAGTARI